MEMRCAGLQVFVAGLLPTCRGGCGVLVAVFCLKNTHHFPPRWPCMGRAFATLPKLVVLGSSSSRGRIASDLALSCYVEHP